MPATHACLWLLRLLRESRAHPTQFADTTMALMLSLLRRTHKLSAALSRGTWMPAVSQLRGARRCAGLKLVRPASLPAATRRPPIFVIKSVHDAAEKAGVAH